MIEIFDIAIRLEENGNKRYEKAALEIQHPTLRNICEWMALEEKKHAEFFYNLKKEAAHLENDHLISEMSSALVHDYIGNQTFSLSETDFNQVKTTEELIRIFTNFENDTIIFYEMLKSFISDKSIIESIDRIIREERSHIEAVKPFLPFNP
jgi:rubrerythrin